MLALALLLFLSVCWCVSVSAVGTALPSGLYREVVTQRSTGSSRIGDVIFPRELIHEEGSLCALRSVDLPQRPASSAGATFICCDLLSGS